MSLGSQIAGIAGKATGSVGGAPIMAALIVSGVVIGGLAGGFAGQPTPPGTSSSELDIYPCWKIGTVFAKAPPGQKIWVTGKNADGSWYRVYTGSPTHPEGWVHAVLVTIPQPSAVPVVDCAPITALTVVGSPFETDTPVQNNSPSPPPTPVPTATPKPTATATATPTPSPTPKPTPRPTPKPTPKPTPTPIPDTIPPKVSTPGASPTTIYDSFRCFPTTSTVTTTATDAETGLASVVLFYKQINDNVFKSKPMTKAAGSDRWSASISAPTEGFHSDITFYVVATDNAGNKTTARSTQTIIVVACPPA